MGKNPTKNEDYALLFYIECKYKESGTLYGVAYDSTTMMVTIISLPSSLLLQYPLLCYCSTMEQYNNIKRLEHVLLTAQSFNIA